MSHGDSPALSSVRVFSLSLPKSNQRGYVPLLEGPRECRVLAISSHVELSDRTFAHTRKADIYNPPAGLFFCPAPRSNTDMDESLERIIRQTLEDARSKGRDYLTQTELAVRAVCQARPDMTASAALTAVNMVRRS